LRILGSEYCKGRRGRVLGRLERKNRKKRIGEEYKQRIRYKIIV
jgi:hypothetical protein